jgi:hypothetical protein
VKGRAELASPPVERASAGDQDVRALRALRMVRARRSPGADAETVKQRREQPAPPSCAWSSSNDPPSQPTGRGSRSAWPHRR